ncbi:glycosyltransferase family 2 protein [Clostridium perfringens]|uniref:glycosyltransferase family 2 protein n=1 Tax=Clostridium perfringens TaxID=1502 RepID=UPI00111FC626|nr:glycosyltransferase family 2 protein [Clostridium perfringens]TPE20423.1 glycosyltransferase family 2 protein [Clostridium perfringens]
MNNICCIIVTYNIGNELSKCFYSILNQVDKVIIVDNGSDLETVKYINHLKKEHSNKVEYLLNQNNMGIAFALNRGIELALKENFEWILTLDNDSIATEGMVDVMLKTYSKLSKNEQKDVVSLFPTHLEINFKNFKNEKSEFNKLNYNYIETDITSGNILNKKLFYSVGFFNESLFIDYVDFEYCLRLSEYGYKQIKVHDAKLIHHLGNSKQIKIFNKRIDYTNHSALRRYYITRNRFFIWNKFKKHKAFITFDKSAFIKETIKIILFENNKYQKIKMTLKGFKDYKNKKFGKLKEI